jgi:hypothetical protein
MNQALYAHMNNKRKRKKKRISNFYLEMKKKKFLRICFRIGTNGE